MSTNREGALPMLRIVLDVDVSALHSTDFGALKSMQVVAIAGDS